MSPARPSAAAVASAPSVRPNKPPVSPWIIQRRHAASYAASSTNDTIINNVHAGKMARTLGGGIMASGGGAPGDVTAAVDMLADQAAISMKACAFSSRNTTPITMESTR